MIEILGTINTSWTSLSDLLETEDHPQWSSTNTTQNEIQQIIEQNKLLKLIRQNIKDKQKLENLKYFNYSFCQKGDSTHNRSTSNSSKESIGLKRKISRSSSKSNLKPIRKQALAISQYQKIMSQIRNFLTPHQQSILNNLIWQLKQSRSKSKQFKSKELILMSQLSQYNSIISNLEEQLKKSQTKMAAIQSNIKTKQNQIIIKQRCLSRFQMTLFLKQKMLFQQTKKLNFKLSLLNQKEQHIQTQRNQIQNMYSLTFDKVQISQTIKEGVLAKYKNYLSEQRKSLMNQQRQIEKQHQYLLNLIKEIETIKVVQIKKNQFNSCNN